LHQVLLAGRLHLLLHAVIILSIIVGSYPKAMNRQRYSEIAVVGARNYWYSSAARLCLLGTANDVAHAAQSSVFEILTA